VNDTIVEHPKSNAVLFRIEIAKAKPKESIIKSKKRGLRLVIDSGLNPDD
jgi:hypothetical protein